MYIFRDFAKVIDPLYSEKFDRFERKFDVSDSIFFISYFTVTIIYLSNNLPSIQRQRPLKLTEQAHLFVLCCVFAYMRL